MTFSLFHVGIHAAFNEHIYQDYGFYAELDATIPLSKKLLLQPEVYYSESLVQSYSSNSGLITETLASVTSPIRLTYKGKPFGSLWVLS